jgi:flavodoxin
MKTGIICHSHSGITRGIAEKVQAALGGILIEVQPVQRYSKLSVIPKGCYRALKGIADPVEPSGIDVSDLDLVVIGSPVWAGRPTPVINGTIDTIRGAAGKKAFIVVTCNDRKSGDTAVASLAARCVEKGLVIAGSGVLDRQQVRDEGAVSHIISMMKNSGGP